MPARNDLPETGPVSFEMVRRLALALPGVEEGTAYRTPALRVRKKFLARLREDNETLVVMIGTDERDVLMQVDPDVFYTTDHYRNYPAVLVRLAKVSPDRLREVLVEAWRRCAPKRLVASAGLEGSAGSLPRRPSA